MNFLSASFLTFQLLILAFIGGFARTTTAQPSLPTLTTNILFYLAWCLLSTPYKSLTLHSMTLLLLCIGLTFECNLLFSTFWYNVFTQFSTTSYEITYEIVIQSSVAIFPALLVVLDCVGIFSYWQVYLLLVPVLNLGWSLNYAILRYGLQIFDGGVGMSVFLFSGVCALTIWVMSVRGRYSGAYRKDESYEGYTLGLAGGVVGVLLLWPGYNAANSGLTAAMGIVTQGIRGNSILFSSTAYSNTILALSMGFLLSFTVINRYGSEKNKIKTTIDCFLNSGIICASFIDLALNPAAVMTCALVSTILTLTFTMYHKHRQERPNKLRSQSVFLAVVEHYSRALFRIVLTLLGSIVTAIVVASRQNSTVPLLDVTTGYGETIYSRTAGLEVAGWLVTTGVAVVVGVLCGCVINGVVAVMGGWEGRKEEDKEVGEIGEIKGRESPVKAGLQTGYRSNNINQSVSSPIRKNLNFNLSPAQNPQQPSDMHFFAQLQPQTWPLYLQPEDKYIDQQQTARKMLNQAILSHVKASNQTYHYVSLSKNNQANISTNPYTSNNDKISRKLQYGTAKQYESRGRKGLERQVVLKNRMTPVVEQNVQTPKSSALRRNLLQGSQEDPLKFQMPKFYVEHMQKSQGKMQKLQEPEMQTRKRRSHSQAVLPLHSPAFSADRVISEMLERSEEDSKQSEIMNQNKISANEAI